MTKGKHDEEHENHTHYSVCDVSNGTVSSSSTDVTMVSQLSLFVLPSSKAEERRVKKNAREKVRCNNKKIDGGKDENGTYLFSKKRTNDRRLSEAKRPKVQHPSSSVSPCSILSSLHLLVSPTLTIISPSITPVVDTIRLAPCEHRESSTREQLITASSQQRETIHASIVAKHVAEAAELTAKVDSMMNEHELQKRRNEELVTAIEQQKVELQKVELSTDSRLRKTSELHNDAMSRTAQAHNEAISAAERAHNKEMQSAARDASDAEQSWNEKFVNMQADQEMLVNQIGSFGQYVPDNSNGDQVILKLKSMQECQALMRNGAPDCWALAEDDTHASQDAFTKIQHQVKMLNQKRDQPIKLDFGFRESYFILAEMSQWLQYVRDETCTFIRCRTIAHYLHTTLLTPFVKHLEQVYMRKRGKYSVKDFADHHANVIPSSFDQHRHIIHIFALHCHLRLMLWHVIYPFDAQHAYKKKIIDLASCLYAQLYARTEEFKIERVVSDAVHLTSNQRATVLNEEQWQLGRHWCIFTSTFPPDDKSIDPSTGIIATLVNRYQYNDDIVKELTSHIKQFTAIANPTTAFVAIARRVGIMYEDRFFMERPAEWVLKVLSNDDLLSFLTDVVKGIKKTTKSPNVTKKSIVDKLFNSIASCRTSVEQDQTLAPPYPLRNTRKS